VVWRRRAVMSREREYSRREEEYKKRAGALS